MKNSIEKLLPFFSAILIFIIASLAYFSPVLKGEKLFQSDIAQFRGMSKEVADFRKENDAEPYWTNRAFGGMPTYQLSAYYPHNYIKKVDLLLRFLPRPVDYLFLYFLGFFILLYVLKVEWKLAILGALAFGFSTYLIIIFGAGHNAKAHAIAYMPVVLAGIITVFQKRYFLGFIITTMGMAFEINANHPQMTYYLLFAVLILGIVYLIDAIKQKEIKNYLQAIGLLSVAVVLALGMNSTGLLATKEYASHSTRSKSELTIKPNGSPKEEITSGLSKEYITQYSIEPAENLNVLIPRFYGGGSRENIGKESQTYEFLKDKIGRSQAKNFAENFPGYWGEQIIIEAPAYIGAVLIFLFVLGAFYVKGTLKKWLVAATVFSFVLSWGRHFQIVTNFFIDYVPLYNKFRAVSSIQVIAELTVPLLAILTLQRFLNAEKSSEEKLKYLKYALYGIGGITLLFVLAGTSLFSFESFRDASMEQQISGISEAFIADRKSLFFKDSLRSFILILLTAGIIWAFIKEKIHKNAVLILLGLLILFDLVGVNRRYINNDDFESKSKNERPFVASEVDQEILKDTSYYRVANFAVNPLNDGSTSYFHNSIGGYHAAKPRRYEELFEYQIAKNNFEVLNMLNTKYIIFADQQGNVQVQQNTDANGNAWFVSEVEFVDSADIEMKALDSLKTKEKAVIASEFKDFLPKTTFAKDSAASINLTNYKPNELTYVAKVSVDQLAVFSDMYYKNGWNAYVDNELTPHFRANYVLRAKIIPKGEHIIKFKFEPTVIKKGNNITLASYGLWIVILVGWLFIEKRKK
ncbi:MAG: hypothetical protein HKN90_02200 [Flavobacteriaceae bacterium]|nr:hypothetical protein [Flavobacteriaceae bacterium]